MELSPGMIKLYGKRGFEYGLSYPQITRSHLGDRHHEDQATAASNNNSPKYMARNM
jgi:predicted acetyltransferase